MTIEQSVAEQMSVLPAALQQQVLDFVEFLVQKRRQQEAVVIERYRQGAISCGKLGEMLGLPSRWEAEAFLQEQGIELNYDEQELEQDLATIEALESSRSRKPSVDEGALLQEGHSGTGEMS